MSDLEFFNPGEGGESYDPAAFERFKEKIKKNAKFIAALHKGEQKQKKKEDRLAKILLKFIQTNQKSGILMLAAKLIEENIPASFVLSIIILGNEEVRAEIQKENLDLPQISAPQTAEKTDFSLITGFVDQSLPLKIKAEIDSWGKGIIEAGLAVPFRVLETVLNKEGNVKKVVIDCAANVLDDFLTNANQPQIAYDTCFSFCEFLIKGVMRRLQKQIENQKELASSGEPL